MQYHVKNWYIHGKTILTGDIDEIGLGISIPIFHGDETENGWLLYQKEGIEFIIDKKYISSKTSMEEANRLLFYWCNY